MALTIIVLLTILKLWNSSENINEYNSYYVCLEMLAFCYIGLTHFKKENKFYI